VYFAFPRDGGVTDIAGNASVAVGISGKFVVSGIGVVWHGISAIHRTKYVSVGDLTYKAQ
jgi:hypothetical protein